MIRFLVSLLTVALLMGLTIAAFSKGDAKQTVVKNKMELPGSLDKLYPPQAPGPVYLGEMIKLANHFSGIQTDLAEGDVENALVNFKAFADQYESVAKLVPEWESYYSVSDVSELGTALRSGDQQQIGSAFKKIGAQCHDCHSHNMTSTYQRYHWGDYDRISLNDPLSGEEISFARLMQLTAADLDGIGNDLGQGQTEQALVHARGLGQRYQALRETCFACHDSERRYYVDDEIMGMIAEIESVVSQPGTEPAAAFKLVESIGMESCRKCHLVHVPAAFQK